MDTDLYGHRPRNVNLCRGWEYPISRLNLSAASSVGGWEIFRSRRRLESSSPYAVDSSNPSLCQFYFRTLRFPTVEIASQRGLQPLPRALPEFTADAV